MKGIILPQFVIIINIWMVYLVVMQNGMLEQLNAPRKLKYRNSQKKKKKKKKKKIKN